MRGFLVLAWLVAVAAPRPAAAQKIIVFVDGTRMEIQSYEVQEGVVLLTTREGKLQSVPRSYVNLVATEQLNRSGGAQASPAPAPRPARPAPPPPEPVPIPTESIEPEPPVLVTPPGPDPVASPPPVWSSDELQVSLVVPSAAWKVEDMPPSFDVAVSLGNESTEAKATLALIRGKLRGRGDFRNLVEEVESSISQAPGYQELANGAVALDPYTGHEFRFLKSVGFVPVYNRLIVFYSRDLAYVLSLTCPENRLRENEADFDALARGLVIKKSRDDVSF